MRHDKAFQGRRAKHRESRMVEMGSLTRLCASLKISATPRSSSPTGNQPLQSLRACGGEGCSQEVSRMRRGISPGRHVQGCVDRSAIAERAAHFWRSACGNERAAIQGQVEHKRCSTLGRTVDGHRAAMAFHDAFDERQPDAPSFSVEVSLARHRY